MYYIRKGISFLLCMCLICSLVTVPARQVFAEEATVVDSMVCNNYLNGAFSSDAAVSNLFSSENGLVYSVSNSELTVTSNGGILLSRNTHSAPYTLSVNGQVPTDAGAELAVIIGSVNNFHQFFLTRDGSTGNALFIYARFDSDQGFHSHVVKDLEVAFSYNSWYNIRLEVSPTEVTAYLDDTLMNTYQLTGLSAQPIGLRVSQNTVYSAPTLIKNKIMIGSQLHGFSAPTSLEVVKPAVFSLAATPASGTAITGDITVSAYDSENTLYKSMTVSQNEGQYDFTLLPGGKSGTHRIAINTSAGNGEFYLDMATIDTVVSSPEDEELYDFFDNMKYIIKKEIRTINYNGVTYYENKEWLRDHIHILKATRYWNLTDTPPILDPRTPLELWITLQFDNGLYPEIVVNNNDSHISYTTQDLVTNLDDGRSIIRLEAENDIEFLMAQGIYQAWKATGDDEWVTTPVNNKLSPLASLEKALTHITTDTQKRWNADYGLLMRGVSCDTWDWIYGTTDSNRRIEPTTPMAIFYGDNTGLYQACIYLAEMYRELTDNTERAEFWEAKAEAIRTALMKYTWNGKYFAHMVHVRPTKEDRPAAWQNDLEGDWTRHSLSNAYTLNREMLKLHEAENIIESFLDMRMDPPPAEFTSGDLFAEWITLYPGYSNTSAILYLPGQYANGAVGSFTAGELMRGAYLYGYEGYGTDILNRLMDLNERDGEIVFMYNHDGSIFGYDSQMALPEYTPQTHSKGGGGPAGWGTAAIYDAMVAGLAGIRDIDDQFNEITFAPAWTASKYQTAYNTVSFATIDDYVAYNYTHNASANSLTFNFTGATETLNASILVPDGKTPTAVYVNGSSVNFETRALTTHNDYNPDSFALKNTYQTYADFTLYRTNTAAVDEIVVTYADSTESYFNAPESGLVYSNFAAVAPATQTLNMGTNGGGTAMSVSGGKIVADVDGSYVNYASASPYIFETTLEPNGSISEVTGDPNRNFVIGLRQLEGRMTDGPFPNVGNTGIQLQFTNYDISSFNLMILPGTSRTSDADGTSVSVPFPTGVVWKKDEALRVQVEDSGDVIKIYLNSILSATITMQGNTSVGTLRQDDSNEYANIEHYTAVTVETESGTQQITEECAVPILKASKFGFGTRLPYSGIDVTSMDIWLDLESFPTLEADPVYDVDFTTGSAALGEAWTATKSFTSGSNGLVLSTTASDRITYSSALGSYALRTKISAPLEQSDTGADNRNLFVIGIRQPENNAPTDGPYTNTGFTGIQLQFTASASVSPFAANSMQIRMYDGSNRNPDTTVSINVPFPEGMTLANGMEVGIVDNGSNIKIYLTDADGELTLVKTIQMLSETTASGQLYVSDTVQNTFDYYTGVAVIDALTNQRTEYANVKIPVASQTHITYATRAGRATEHYIENIKLWNQSASPEPTPEAFPSYPAYQLATGNAIAGSWTTNNGVNKQASSMAVYNAASAIYNESYARYAMTAKMTPYVAPEITTDSRASHVLGLRQLSGARLEQGEGGPWRNGTHGILIQFTGTDGTRPYGANSFEVIFINGTDLTGTYNNSTHAQWATVPLPNEAVYQNTSPVVFGVVDTENLIKIYANNVLVAKITLNEETTTGTIRLSNDAINTVIPTAENVTYHTSGTITDANNNPIEVVSSSGSTTQGSFTATIPTAATSHIGFGSRGCNNDADGFTVTDMQIWNLSLQRIRISFANVYEDISGNASTVNLASDDTTMAVSLKPVSSILSTNNTSIVSNQGYFKGWAYSDSLGNTETYTLDYYTLKSDNSAANKTLTADDDGLTATFTAIYDAERSSSDGVLSEAKAQKVISSDGSKAIRFLALLDESFMNETGTGYTYTNTGFVLTDIATNPTVEGGYQYSQLAKTYRQIKANNTVYDAQSNQIKAIFDNFSNGKAFIYATLKIKDGNESKIYYATPYVEYQDNGVTRRIYGKTKAISYAQLEALDSAFPANE